MSFFPDPTPDMIPNRVTIHRFVRYADDEAGGRTAVYADPTAADTEIRCAVHPTSERDTPSHLRESTVTYLTVLFYADPGVVYRDKLVWVDGRGEVMIANGRGVNSGGRGRTFKVLTEYRT